MTGFVTFHREIRAKESFIKRPAIRHSFQDMVMEASWDDREVNFHGHVISLRRGQFLTTQRLWATTQKISRGAAIRQFATLKKQGRIKIDPIHLASRRDPLASIVTIVNYDVYQSPRRQTDPPPPKYPIHTKQVKQNKRGREIPPQKIPKPKPPEIGSPLFLDSLGDKTEPVKAILNVFNQSKTELIPPVDIGKLSPQVLKTAITALSLDPCLETWKKAFVRVGQSRWLTGQEPGKDGRFFDTTSVFEFVVGKRQAILEGRYDMSRKKEVSIPKKTVVIGQHDLYGDGSVMVPLTALA